MVALHLTQRHLTMAVAHLIVASSSSLQNRLWLAKCASGVHLRAIATDPSAAKTNLCSTPSAEDSHPTDRPAAVGAKQGAVAITDDANTLCVVCWDEEPTHILAPCGHMCTCGHCSANLLECPMCRARVLSVVSRVYKLGRADK